MELRRDGFFIVQAFMINDLDLKGNELMVYAIIYGYSQNENQYFTGSLSYLASWINSSKQTTMKILNNLIEKKLLKKEEVIIKNVKYCKYKALINSNLKDLDRKENCIGMQESCIGDTKKLYGGMQETLPNNIYNNINKNIEDNIDNNNLNINKLDINNNNLNINNKLNNELNNKLNNKLNNNIYLNKKIFSIQEYLEIFLGKSFP